ncbi:inositol monophosphatase family protein [Fodinibius halophilus]|uniref:Inositol-1-monophosphatase n=1 Tax=Fodinibius halophilus TaxID=1736908 RepID=A0A6M1T813_9BACT|nr:inositol monophosphatase family protein [Fodinibius halophilus]NGP88111.1 inositol monophosphatase [Fodinibius halophilus]
MSDYTAELNIAKQAAKSAAEIIKKYQRDRNFSVDYKGKNDLVTEADVKAEKEVLSVIEKEFPDDHILAEETAGELSLPEGRTWLVDPIDGTTNFTHGFPVYCVSIALWDQKEPQMAVVLEVSGGEIFTAVAGKGAYLDGNPITVSKLTDPKDALVGTGFPYNDMSLVDNYLKFFRMLMENIRGVRRPGAASYDLCCVASGRFDGFYEYALNPWDVAAAALIVKEAGGKVSDWQGGDDWLFGERIVAGNPVMHEFLLEEISKYFEEGEIDTRHKVTG